MEVIPTGREPKAIIMAVKQKIRLPLLDLTSYLQDVQYSVVIILAGGVNMSDMIVVVYRSVGLDDNWRYMA